MEGRDEKMFATWTSNFGVRTSSKTSTMHVKGVLAETLVKTSVALAILYEISRVALSSFGYDE
jgi:hypothetical protein